MPKIKKGRKKKDRGLYGSKKGGLGRGEDAQSTHTATALERSLADSLYQQQGKDVVVVVDANNVRGKTTAEFEWTLAELLGRLRRWRHQFIKNHTTNNRLDILCVVDHGTCAQVFDYHDLGMLVFAGPDQTADDVIAAATKWLTTSDMNSTATRTPIPNVFVVTSDRELKQRCLRNNRPGNVRQKRKQKDYVKAFDSRMMVQCLQQMDINRDLDQATNLSDIKTTIKMEDTSMAFENGVRQAHSSHTSSSLGFAEKTWHRVLFAEHLRRLVSQCNPPFSNNKETNASKDPIYLQSFCRKFLQKVEDRVNKNRTTTISTMFLDQRIRKDPYQKQELLHFLDQFIVDAVASSSLPTPTSSIVPTTTTDDDFLSTEVDSCTEFLRYLMTTMHREEEQDHALVSRYTQTAPRRLQFSQDSSVLDLVRLVRAIPESLSDRLAEKDIQDEALVQMGQIMERKWWGDLELKLEPTD